MKPEAKTTTTAAAPLKSVKLKRPHEHRGVLEEVGATIKVTSRTADWLKNNGIGDIVGEATPTA